MPKGWVLVSLYIESYPENPETPIFVDFAHYTGRQAPGGGHEYDKVLKGHLSYNELRRALRKYLTLTPGNAKKEGAL